MNTSELKDFIIKARSNDAVKFSEFAETLYTNYDSLRKNYSKSINSEILKLLKL